MLTSDGWWSRMVLPQTREELETNSQKQNPTTSKAQGCDRCGRTNCSCAMVRLAVGVCALKEQTAARVSLLLSLTLTLTLSLLALVSAQVGWSGGWMLVPLRRCLHQKQSACARRLEETLCEEVVMVVIRSAGWCPVMCAALLVQARAQMS